MLASRRQLTRCRNSSYTSNPPMARGPSSDEKKPEPPPCPKCGKLLGTMHRAWSWMEGES